MRIIASDTGSQGNCSVIQSENGNNFIVIDVGLKYKSVDKQIGYKLHKADCILITHEHKDHTEHIGEFLKTSIPVYMGEKTFQRVCSKFYHSYHLIFSFNPIETEGFIITPFPLYHTNSDGTDCECFGFLILDKSTGEKMLWASDTKYIKNTFPPLEYYCLESNYFEKDSYEGEADYVEKSVEIRRVKSHMSFETVVKFLEMQDLSKCKEIHLLHVSHSVGNKVKEEMKEKMENVIKRGVSVYV